MPDFDLHATQSLTFATTHRIVSTLHAMIPGPRPLADVTPRAQWLSDLSAKAALHRPLAKANTIVAPPVACPTTGTCRSAVHFTLSPNSSFRDAKHLLACSHEGHVIRHFGGLINIPIYHVSCAQSKASHLVINPSDVLRDLSAKAMTLLHGAFGTFNLINVSIGGTPVVCLTIVALDNLIELLQHKVAGGGSKLGMSLFCIATILSAISPIREWMVKAEITPAEVRAAASGVFAKCSVMTYVCHHQHPLTLAAAVASAAAATLAPKSVATLPAEEDSCRTETDDEADEARVRPKSTIPTPIQTSLVKPAPVPVAIIVPEPEHVVPVAIPIVATVVASKPAAPAVVTAMVDSDSETVDDLPPLVQVSAAASSSSAAVLPEQQQQQQQLSPDEMRKLWAMQTEFLTLQSNALRNRNRNRKRTAEAAPTEQFVASHRQRRA